MRQIKAIAVIILVMSLNPGCIHEDRSNCPTYLTLDFSDTPEDVSYIHLFIRSEDGKVFRDTIVRSEFADLYEVSFKRGQTDIAAFSDIDRMVYDNGYRIAEGDDADNLYTCFTTSVYRSDLSSDKITVLKNNIGLYIRVMGHASDNLYIVVESSSIGYDLHGNILDGNFEHRPEALHTPNDEEAYFEFFSRITRQKDESLTLTVYTTSGATVAVIRLFPLLVEAGIDMNDESLEDLYLTVDHTLSSLIVSPDGWDSTEHTEILF